jgi:hypothetical protein
MANNQANITAVITAQDKASAVLKDFGGQVDKTSESATGSMNKLNASFLATAAATAGLVAFGKKSLDAFNQQDLAVTRLQAGINNVKSATDKHIDSLIAQAAALQKTTRFSDEAYISAQGILSTFQLNQTAIAKLTPRLADMSEGLARVTGEMPDLEGNAILVAKALGGEDVVGLVGALRRVGVVMTKTQTDMLQTGTQAQRLAVITQVLDQNFKGMAEAAGGTTAGKMAELKNQFNELQEAVGKTIAEGLTPFLNILNAHPAVLAIVTGSLGALAIAFVSVKVAAAIGTTIDGVTVAMNALSVSTNIATGSLIALSTVSLAAWGVGIIALFIQMKNTILATADAVNNAFIAARSDNDAQIRQLQKQAAAARALGDTAQVNRIANAIASLEGGRAAGGPVRANAAYIVGEQGPELFVPDQGGSIVPNNKLNSQPSVNITIQAGAFMGSDIEARKFAQLIVRHYNDAMNSKSGAAFA